eukprot:11224023-Lingulodinium_polyedra.AAC.1
MSSVKGSQVLLSTRRTAGRLPLGLQVLHVARVAGGIIVDDVGVRQREDDLLALRLVFCFDEGPCVVFCFVDEVAACVHILHDVPRDLRDEIGDALPLADPLRRRVLDPQAVAEADVALRLRD